MVSSPVKSKKTKNRPRQLKIPKFKSPRMRKRIKQTKKPLTGAFRLFWRSFRPLFKNWKLFGGITIVYVLLTIILVKGFGGNNTLAQLQSVLQSITHSPGKDFETGFALFGVLLGNASSTSSDVAGAYQSMLLLVMSLVIIWSLRQVLSDKKTKVTVKSAFYKGLYPLVPFLLVLLIIGLQLMPLVLGSLLINLVFGSGLAVTLVEQALWIILFAGMTLWSLYMVTSSVFALYIVTLPNVTPMQAVRSARNIVAFRRWSVMRKVIFLPIVLLIIAALIIIPLIILSPTVAEWVFFVLSMTVLIITHSYFYSLYRELL